MIMQYPCQILACGEFDKNFRANGACGFGYALDAKAACA